MSDTTTFDYYYGDESSQFSFYRIPRQLITGEQFKRLSTDAKLLYGLLLDRMGLSAKNGWYDDLGRVYIYYTLYEIQEDLNCGHDNLHWLHKAISNLKAFLLGTYHGRCTNLQAYLDEYCFRFNRRMTGNQIFLRLTRAVATSCSLLS